MLNRIYLVSFAIAILNPLDSSASDRRDASAAIRPTLNAPKLDSSTPRLDLRRLDRELRERSEADAVRVFGRPQSIREGSFGRTIWSYANRSYFIEFRHGRVRYVGEPERQTGVNEDESIGLLGIGASTGGSNDVP